MVAVLLVHAVASVVAFALYGLDKARAARGGRRVRERTLHAVEALGGWPGALVASAAFRHKTRKTSFRAVRGLIVALHLAGWALWAIARA